MSTKERKWNNYFNLVSSMFSNNLFNLDLKRLVLTSAFGLSRVGVEWQVEQDTSRINNRDSNDVENLIHLEFNDMFGCQNF